MTDFFIAISEDGIRFRLNRDFTWEPETDVIQAAPGGFRSSNWGDSLQQVKAAESDSAILEDTDFLAYETRAAGADVLLTFTFVNGMLAKGGYKFNQEHSENNDYYYDFERVKGLLVKKYGPPVLSKEYWFNDLFREDPLNKGAAISCGHHSLLERWEDDATAIELWLTGDNFKIEHRLSYQSKRLESLLNSQIEQKQLVGL